MARDFTKAALWWTIVTQAEDIERWIRGRLITERRISRRQLLERALSVVQRARRDPSKFVDEVDEAWEILFEIYQDYRKTRNR